MLIESLAHWTYVAVFVLAAIPWVELAVVIPVGILIGLHPLPVSILSFLGNWITVFLLIVLFERFHQWREIKKGIDGDEAEEGTSKRSRRAQRIWTRYGLPGLALISPIITGTHIAAAVAMAFKAPKQWVTFWMSVSLFVWTIVLALAAHYGIEFLGTSETHPLTWGE